MTAGNRASVVLSASGNVEERTEEGDLKLAFVVKSRVQKYGEIKQLDSKL